MRTFCAYLCVALLHLLACSQPMMTSCPEGMLPCQDACVPQHSGCPGPPTGDASLSSLRVSAGALSPAFAASTSVYSLRVPFWLTAVQVTPTAAEPTATLQVNGVAVLSGNASAPIALGSGPTTISILVRTTGGTERVYDIVVMRSQGTSDYLKASNTGMSDQFGVSVSLSGDTLAVGAYQESSRATGVDGNQADDGAVGSGAVYVFQRTGATWTQQAYLKASNPGADDQFGYSVSLSGDTLAIGAPYEDSNATGIDGPDNNLANNSGAVYVFKRTGAAWTQQAYLKPSNTGGAYFFGQSVSLSGDTLAVGAYGERSRATGVNGSQADDNVISSGAVYVFQRTGATWVQQAYVKASNTEREDYFGRSVSLSGDTLAVGAYGEDSSATGLDGDQADNNAFQAGAVYLFQRTGTTWAQQAYIKASNTGPQDCFGWSVSLSGDTLAVGAFGERSRATGVNGDQSDDSILNGGAVYVFQRTGTTWAQQAYLKASNTGAGDRFGWSVSLSGDTLAVAAKEEDSNATGYGGNQADDSVSNSGAVYFFR